MQQFLYGGVHWTPCDRSVIFRRCDHNGLRMFFINITVKYQNYNLLLSISINSPSLKFYQQPHERHLLVCYLRNERQDI